MCYSAMVRQGLKTLQRRFNARPDFDQMELIFRQRLDNSSLRIARAFEANFDEPQSAQERRIKDMIEKHRAVVADDLVKELFAQKQRLADAERKLEVKETKAARDSVRIATKKIDTNQRKLDDLKRSEVKARDSRIFPMYYAPIVINDDGEHKIVLARYHCRQKGKPAEIDQEREGLYNARRDNLERFWRREFGHTHGLLVIDSFFENVTRAGKNAVLQFTPQPAGDMLVACLYALWGEAGKDELLSFAAITDEPPAEVAAAGHDRCVVNLKESNVAAWLTPEGRELAELRAILDDIERPKYEHREAA